MGAFHFTNGCFKLTQRGFVVSGICPPDDEGVRHGVVSSFTEGELRC